MCWLCNIRSGQIRAEFSSRAPEAADRAAPSSGPEGVGEQAVAGEPGRLVVGPGDDRHLGALQALGKLADAPRDVLRPADEGT